MASIAFLRRVICGALILSGLFLSGLASSAEGPWPTALESALNQTGVMYSVESLNFWHFDDERTSVQMDALIVRSATSTVKGFSFFFWHKNGQTWRHYVDYSEIPGLCAAVDGFIKRFDAPGAEQDKTDYYYDTKGGLSLHASPAYGMELTIGKKGSLACRIPYVVVTLTFRSSLNEGLAFLKSK